MNKIDIYADGIKPDKAHIDNLIDNYGIVGFTCNPSLIKNYLPISYYDYCKVILDNSRELPVSIQVLESDLDKIVEQAEIISSWGDNVYVKVPIINEYNVSCADIIVYLLDKGIKVNVTAIFTSDQVKKLVDAGLNSKHDCVLSVFSGRISDTGRVANSCILPILDVIGCLHRGKRIYGNIKILWAGVRQVTDINYARLSCDIITIPQPVLDKMDFIDKDLDEYCLETVQMFARDSKHFTI